MIRPTQHKGREAHGQLARARFTPWRGWDLRRKAALLWQPLDERKQQRRLILILRHDFPVLAGSQAHLRIGRRRRNVLVDIALSIRHAGDVACRRQDIEARLVASIQRCDSFSAVWRARRELTLPPVRFHTLDRRDRAPPRLRRPRRERHAEDHAPCRPCPPGRSHSRAPADHPRPARWCPGSQPPHARRRAPQFLQLHALISRPQSRHDCAGKANLRSSARVPASRRMHDDRRSTIAAWKLAPFFPGGGRQTAPDRTRSLSSSPPNR